MQRLITSLMVLLTGCAVPHHMPAQPINAGPDRPLGWSPSTGQPRPINVPLIDVTQDNVAATWTCEPTLIDTSTFARQHQLETAWEGPTQRPGKLLPPHKSQKPTTDDNGMPNDLRPGGLENLSRGGNVWGFESILQTPWTPPDPALAVGPDHVLVTVNMAIAWYDKETGTEQFSARLDSTGSPGFFEDVGAGSFTFDPKCFYDPVAERFVVLALEVYSDTAESWITLAISDDSDPNGIWYKYRTWSVVQNGNQQHWVDYPGLGFDTDAFYVTGNLFGLDDNSGWGGVLYRTIEKEPLLTGDTAVIHDVRKGGHASVQCAQHYGETPLAFFVSRRNSTSLRISRILDHTSPTVSSSNVAVPEQSSPPGAPNPGGVIDTLDGRILNVIWRDEHLYTCHAIEDGPDATCARWYDIDVNTPASPVLYQSGNIHTLSGDTYFPAIAANMYGDIAIAVGKCAVDDVPSIQVTGRSSDDPLGSMDLLTETATGTHGADGRYGDYFDMTVDPVDDTTFWYVAEYSRDFGWQTYVGRYTITEPNTCPTDIDGDGVTGVSDLLAIIAWWGTQDDSADVNNDGLVNVGDLLECIAAYGPC